MTGRGPPGSGRRGWPGSAVKPGSPPEGGATTGALPQGFLATGLCRGQGRLPSPDCPRGSRVHVGCEPSPAGLQPPTGPPALPSASNGPKAPGSHGAGTGREAARRLSGAPPLVAPRMGVPGPRPPCPPAQPRPARDQHARAAASSVQDSSSREGSRPFTASLCCVIMKSRGFLRGRTESGPK